MAAVVVVLASAVFLAVVLSAAGPRVPDDRYRSGWWGRFRKR